MRSSEITSVTGLSSFSWQVPARCGHRVPAGGPAAADGKTSLVGPRPPLQREVEAYKSRVHRRLYIKPGLTGMWQFNGRSKLSWQDSVRLDVFYVENWSLAGDITILWRTARMMKKPVGAY